ncbi:MAG: hypothetical protein HYY84_02770 [Deltaproteobacteria bacterium]|nr:hypothetical protein [Deltaproteobacteria bacterium]
MRSCVLTYTAVLSSFVVVTAHTPGATADKKAKPKTAAPVAPPKKPTPQPAAKPATAVALSPSRTALTRVRFKLQSRWKRTGAHRAFIAAYKFQRIPALFKVDRDRMPLSEAKRIAGMKKPALETVPVAVIARALFVLEMEAKADAKAFRAALNPHKVKHGEREVDLYPDIEAQVADFRELYDVPCRGDVTREGANWPPAYKCTEPPERVTLEPTAFVTLKSPLTSARPLTDSDGPSTKKPDPDHGLASARKNALKKRDTVPLPDEAVAKMPTQFCVKGGGCYGNYAQIVSALYSGAKATESLPVFCAPEKLAAAKTSETAKETDVWDHTKVTCSTNWTDTLGGWFPWLKDGEPAAAPKTGELPPFACVGNPKLLDHVVVPSGGDQKGFHCRRRIFRILSQRAPKSQQDINAQNANMCLEMRQQTWGERYPDVNQVYQKWCTGKLTGPGYPPPPKDKSKCAPLKERPDGSFEIPPLPFMSLSREEMLYFFGHQELFCRADRPGLTHFLDNDFGNDAKWAPSFTCGLSRGLLEGGPFEEGVQLCAITPHIGEFGRLRGLDDLDTRGRLHCWKYNRPTCEEVSADKNERERLDSIVRSNVFDTFDAFREFRRTRNAAVWGLKDPKEVEKIAAWQDEIDYSDSLKDEGTFGVKDFCRFVDGSKTKIRCGYTKQTMSQWYELHKEETPEGCTRGICARGAYKRG